MKKSRVSQHRGRVKNPKYASTVHIGESEGKKIWTVRKRLRTKIKVMEVERLMLTIQIRHSSLCCKRPLEEPRPWKLARIARETTLRKSCMIRLAFRRARPELMEPSVASMLKKEETP